MCFYTRSYPLHFFLILILEKESVFPFSMFSAKQWHYWYHFYKVFGYDAVLNWGLNPGPPALDPSTLPLAVRLVFHPSYFTIISPTLLKHTLGFLRCLAHLPLVISQFNPHPNPHPPDPTLIINMITKHDLLYMYSLSRGLQAFTSGGPPEVSFGMSTPSALSTLRQSCFSSLQLWGQFFKRSLFPHSTFSDVIVNVFSPNYNPTVL